MLFPVAVDMLDGQYIMVINTALLTFTAVG